MMMTESHPDLLSRRDFLKAAVTGGAAGANILFFPRTERSDIPIEKIETPDAVYYPFFIRHDARPDLIRAYQDIGTSLNAHFLEIISSSAAEFQALPVASLLLSNAEGRNQEQYGRLLPDNVLFHFADNNMEVAYEGVNLDIKYFHQGDRIERVKNLAVSGIDATVLIRDFIKKQTGHLKQKDFLVNVGALIATVWQFGPNVLGNISLALNELPPNANVREIQKALNNITAHISDLHPEKLEIFFRNLVMARKIQTLATYLKEKNSSIKPAISFEVGIAHTGIKDLLALGEEVTLAGFSLYRTDVLKDIVGANGGIEAFSSTIVIPVRENLTGPTEMKALIVDKGLQEYLKQRFKS